MCNTRRRHARPAILALLTAMAATVLGTASAPPAEAATTVYGKVTYVADGDTVDVDVAGDGTAKPVRVRVTGINAMELSVYSTKLSRLRGDCHAVDATRRMHSLVMGKRVRLHARDRSARSGSRLRRDVAVKVNGTWRDVGSILLDEGLALWLPSGDEYEHNADYLGRAQRAAAKGIGIWDTDACGGAGGGDLSLSVQWDAPGQDAVNLNGELVEVFNPSAVAVPLGSWLVRDSALRHYTIPKHVVLQPYSSLRIHVGSGRNTATDLYWGLRAPVFENATAEPTSMGDGGYLFDPRGNLRAWQMYPCGDYCPTAGLAGLVDVSAVGFDPPGFDDGKEYVRVRNLSPEPVSLDGYVLRAGAQLWTFPPGSEVAAGRELTVVFGSGDQRALTQFTDTYGAVLANAGGTARVASPDGVVVACSAWGTGAC
nr:lamin tail domain-containing protein [Motilibacter deserti]